MKRQRRLEPIKPVSQTTKLPLCSPTLSRSLAPAASHDPLHGTKLGEYVRHDASLLLKLGWKRFVLARHCRSDLSSCLHLDHPAAPILQGLATQGAPV
jgi:hypothetical protein